MNTVAPAAESWRAVAVTLTAELEQTQDPAEVARLRSARLEALAQRDAALLAERAA